MSCLERKRQAGKTRSLTVAAPKAAECRIGAATVRERWFFGLPNSSLSAFSGERRRKRCAF